MTERKPPGTSFASWVDQRINEAEEQGAFENLPGAGKPLPRRAEADDGQAWLQEYLRREGVSAEDLLPTPLKLRKEVERLAGLVQDLPSEQEVREIVAELNRRIIDWRRIPVGPPVFVPLVNEEKMVSTWRDGQSVTPTAPSPASAGGETRHTTSPRPRWWHRLSRRGRASSEPMGTAAHHTQPLRTSGDDHQPPG